MKTLPLLTLLAILSTSATRADDWPQWRGADRDGISKEKGLLTEWPADGPPLAWKAEGLGIGFSSLAVVKGKIYTLGDLDDGSYAIALSEKNGDLVWKTKVGDPGGHRGYPGTRSTPTVDSTPTSPASMQAPANSSGRRISSPILAAA